MGTIKETWGRRGSENEVKHIGVTLDSRDNWEKEKNRWCRTEGLALNSINKLCVS